MTEPVNGSNSSYRQARTIGGLFLLVLVAVLYIGDLVSPDFAVDSIQLGLLLGTSGLLLGVEGARKLLDR